ncbi:MAG: hypothetical protein PHU43_06255 [Candidatus Bipolaricaulis sp.]|nr:hypothetical protein [Candidatus Bipolaricaulis sp.]
MRAGSRVLRLRLGKSAADVDASLRRVVRAAYAHVPFYRRAWNAAGVAVAGFGGIADLPTLPIVTKEDLLARGLPDRLSD